MRDHIGALLNVRENRLFVGVLNFQHGSSQHGSSQLTPRVPGTSLQSANVMVSLYGKC
jgi:hypothetical protein